MKEKGFNIIIHKEFKKKVHKEFVEFALVAKEIIKTSLDEPPKEVREMLREFQDVFPVTSYA